MRAYRPRVRTVKRIFGSGSPSAEPEDSEATQDVDEVQADRDGVLRDVPGDGRERGRETDRILDVPIEDRHAGGAEDVDLSNRAILAEDEHEDARPRLVVLEGLLRVPPFGLDPLLQLEEVVGVPRVGRVQRDRHLALRELPRFPRPVTPGLGPAPARRGSKSGRE